MGRHVSAASCMAMSQGKKVRYAITYREKCVSICFSQRHQLQWSLSLTGCRLTWSGLTSDLQKFISKPTQCFHWHQDQTISAIKSHPQLLVFYSGRVRSRQRSHETVFTATGEHLSIGLCAIASQSHCQFDTSTAWPLKDHQGTTRR